MQRNHVIDEFLDTVYDLDPVESFKEYLKAADHTHPMLDDELVTTEFDGDQLYVVPITGSASQVYEAVDKYKERLDQLNKEDVQHEN